MEDQEGGKRITKMNLMEVGMRMMFRIMFSGGLW
jgi:hypothetical protein